MARKRGVYSDGGGRGEKDVRKINTRDKKKNRGRGKGWKYEEYYDRMLACSSLAS